MFKDHDERLARIEAAVDEKNAESKADKKTIEAWGEEKGMWPQFPVAGGPGNPNAWKFAAAKAHAGWADNQEVTASEFDKAVADAAGTTQR